MESAIPNLGAAFGLGVAAGLSTFLPLALIALCARFGLISLAPPFAPLGSDVAVVGLLALCLAEMAGDKIPVIDTMLHKLLFPAAVASGGILFAARTGTVTAVHPGAALLFGLLAGGTTAGTVHATRAAVRPFTHFVPLLGGVISAAEDGMALSLAGAALFAPGLVPVLLAGMLAGFATVIYFVVRMLARLGRRLAGWLRDQWNDAGDSGPDGGAAGWRFDADVAETASETIDAPPARRPTEADRRVRRPGPAQRFANWLRGLWAAGDDRGSPAGYDHFATSAAEDEPGQKQPAKVASAGPSEAPRSGAVDLFTWDLDAED